MRKFVCAALIAGILLVTTNRYADADGAVTSDRWSEKQAAQWYERQAWPVGANFLPRNAINQLEMWQAETYDEQEIDRELGWAEQIGMNTMRVFLHDLLWQQDSEAFKNRLDSFLATAAKHHIRPLLVLFDSCWDPDPVLGLQHPPIPGVHNSGWVQSPGRALADNSQHERLKSYVTGVVAAFADDDRILAWDLWNEPNNTNASSYGARELKDKLFLVESLLPQVFEWARSAAPKQPLTSGIWDGDWSQAEKMTAIQKIQLQQSDIISFHNYGWPEDFEKRVKELEAYKRPLICTEYMARPAGSIFDLILPIAKKHKVGAINWGFVKGKSQTYLPWDSWQKPYVLEPPVTWFHDIFHEDGRPYRPAETELIKRFTAEPAKASLKD